MVNPSNYSSNWFRVVKAKIEHEAGVKFKLKDFRPMSTQMCLDRDPNLLGCFEAAMAQHYAHHGEALWTYP